ncbi:glutathione S-transferase family protein [Aspergillus ibericus CBS 121593]|uniref:Glutathione S-transferase n=1 Tax=Aspergillus ibericus CBS 121593 TaxID=1448316 RepID=A0A395GWB1_9EURO|nr:glutathione S-transferase [Aspergillus ibericus CBS 121593]RAK99384.1 glutathione S-transferase [Aspergillus ibericus CBS 121593]
MNVFNDQPSTLTLTTPKGSTTGTTIAILLEELHLPYHLHFNIAQTTLTDIHRTGHSTTLDTFDSITSYLLTQYDESHRFSYPAGSPECAAVRERVQMLMVRMGGHHSRSHSLAHSHSEDGQNDGGDGNGSEESIPSVRKILSLYLHLEEYLQKTRKRYLVGEKCTLADFAHFPYVAAAGVYGLDLERFPELTAWYDRLARQGAVRKGMEAVGLRVDSS